MVYGEYSQPLQRVTNVQVPVISGYVTSRLRATDPIQPAISGQETSMQVVFENVGGKFVYVKLQQTNDHSTSGTRIDVISGVSLVPGGRSTVATTAAYQKFLELACTDGGPTQIRMQITANRRFEQQGFDKVGDATFYPSLLWQAKPIPVAVSS
jgi:hypothetical protein